ncbi:histidine kinase [Methylovirgula sp. HY1]|uniref:histidine kinase n=1 Tax=Methylovirgula sp. HY1 TaxID=2822761 RepID=UPI001C5A623E|nr:histidine kinase [Methylovirgula sp. HY1]QXX73645.1 Signal transduction histidine-protein kinase/phosphatase UhpB [Methylovirgula sp. HY1]
MPLFGMAHRSLRTRVVLIPSSILFLGMLAAVGVTLLAARSRIGSEIQSGVNMGSLLIGYALEKMEVAQQPDAALARLRHELAHVRHISVHYEPDQPQAHGLRIDHTNEARAPDWFLHLFQPARVVKIFPVLIRGVERGRLVMSTRPADEVTEIWSGLVFLTALLAAISVAIVTLLYLTARFTLKPLHDLADGLDRLEHGQFDALAEIEVEELRRIGQKFNHLAHSLARTEADNRLLIERLMSVQDAERKELARELHDEFGASLFGIRAAASCIIEDATQNAAATRMDIVDRAQAISSLADSIQKQNYRILDRIRPVILHQMGLTDAVRQLVESWATTNRDISCALALPQETSQSPRLFGEEASLTSYRIIQECLTNVARHSKAKSVSVSLSVDSTADAAQPPSILIEVEDDGIGLAPDFRFGFGFLGMSERVRKLGGRLEISKGTCSGTLIRAFIPLDDEAHAPSARPHAPTAASTAST